MKPIGLVVDDICSLPEKLINQYQIEIVKTKLFFPEWEKPSTRAKLGAGFPEKNLYQIMKETRATSKTSAPSPGDYLKAYKKLLDYNPPTTLQGKTYSFEKILVITLSSKLSATYSSAFQAKELAPDPSKIFIENGREDHPFQWVDESPVL